MSDETVIQTRGLTKYFGAKAAVYELDLDVPRGCVFAFLGRNGSGKTTTIRMLLGLLAPTRGAGTVLGHDLRRLPPAIRARIGYLTEEHQLYGWMKVREWPARAVCPGCQKRRVVDRQHCEYCGAVFPPPERNGTEIFAVLAGESEAVK